MKLLIDIPDTYTPEDGDAFSAVQVALDHFNIPSDISQLRKRAYAITIYDGISAGDVHEFSDQGKAMSHFISKVADEGFNLEDDLPVLIVTEGGRITEFSILSRDEVTP